MSRRWTSEQRPLSAALLLLLRLLRLVVVVMVTREQIVTTDNKTVNQRHQCACGQ